jgi:hypothetical protein
MAMFCRHNRLTSQCSICRRELEATMPAPPPRARAAPSRQRPRTGAGQGEQRGARRATGGSPRAGGLVTRKLARAADDGYRNPLTPGLRATADAERLAAALALAAERIAPPGPYPALRGEPDREEATWLAFLLALAGPDAPELQASVLEARPGWASGEAPDLPGGRAQTASAYRAWAVRAGSQEAAFSGEPIWTPERRFARVFERLSLPGFGRAARYELLVALGAAGLYPLTADALHVGVEDDATVVAAKRLLVSGDAMLLERRSRDLAKAAGVQIAALDRALVVWNDPKARVEVEPELIPETIRSALRLR